MSVPVTITRSLKALPKIPTLRHQRPKHQLTVSLGGDTATLIASGIRVIAKAIKARPVTSYVELERPHGVERTGYYGPVRFVSLYVMFPTDGGEPGMRYRLDVGLA